MNGMVAVGMLLIKSYSIRASLKLNNSISIGVNINNHVGKPCSVAEMIAKHVWETREPTDSATMAPFHILTDGNARNTSCLNIFSHTPTIFGSGSASLDQTISAVLCCLPH